MASNDVSSQHELGLTLGQRLAAARERRGLELEKAAHDTRIRAQRLRELEADDYSHCPHPSYARMFLRDYAKYLNVPLAEIKGDLPETGECGAGGYQYLEELAGEDLGVPVVQRIKPRRRLMPAIAGVSAVLAIGFLSLQVVLTVRKIDQLNLDKPADSAEVKPAEPPAEATIPVVANAEDVAMLNEPASSALVEEIVAPQENSVPETFVSSPLEGEAQAEEPVREEPPVAALTQEIPVSAPASSTTPAATPDGRAAFVVGSGLDATKKLQ